VVDPDCGADGATYVNACEAACAGVAVNYTGECLDTSNVNIVCQLPNTFGIYCPPLLDGYSVSSYDSYFEGCTIEQIGDCIEYHSLPNEYSDYLVITVCNDAGDCYDVVYQITISDTCIENYNCDVQNACTEAITPIVLCPEFCAFNAPGVDPNYELTFIQSFFTLCSISRIDGECFRYITIPLME